MQNNVGFKITATNLASSVLKNVQKDLRNVANTTNNLTSTMSASFKNVGGSISNFGKSVRGVGSDMMAMSATAGIAMYGAINSATSFSKTINMVGAVTGATAEEFKMLSDQAKELGATTMFSATQAGEAQQFLAMAGFEVDKVYEAMPDILNLAASAQLDMGTAANIATNILTGFGEETENLEMRMDQLTATFTNANTDMLQLGEAMKYVAPVAKSAGAEFEDVATAVGLLGNAGIQASMAGTTLRGAIARTLEPTGQVADAMEELGLTVKDNEGKFVGMKEIIVQLEKAQRSLGSEAEFTGKLMTIFGQRAGPGMAAMVSQGADAYDELREKIEDSAGIMQEIAEKQMEGMAGATARLRSATEALLISLGEKLTPIISTLASGMQNLAAFFQNLPPEIQMTSAVVLSLVAVLGPLLLILGSMISFIGSAVSGIGSLILAIKTLTISSSVLLGPIGLVIAAVTALGFAYVQTRISSWKLEKSTDDLNDSFKELAKTSGVGKAVVRELGNTYQEAFNKVTLAVRATNNTMNSTKGWGVMFDGTSQRITESLQNAEDSIEDFKAEYKKLMTLAGTDKNVIEETLKKITQQTFKSKEAMTELNDEMTALVPKIYESSGAFIEEFEKLKQSGVSTVTALKESFKEIKQAFPEYGKEAMVLMLEELVKKEADIHGVAKAHSLAYSMGLTGPQAKQLLKQTGLEVSGAVLGEMLRKSIDAKNYGEMYALLLGAGISENEIAAIKASKDMVQSTIDVFKNQSDDARKNGYGLGASLLAGVVKGILANMPALNAALSIVTKKMSGLAASVKTGFQKFADNSGLGNLIAPAVNNITSLFSTQQDAVITGLKGTEAEVDDLSNDINATLEKLGSGGGGGGSKMVEDFDKNIQSVEEGFENMRLNASQSVESLTAEFDANADQMIASIKSITDSIDDLNEAFGKETGKQEYDFAEQIVKQGEKITDIETKISQARISLAKATKEQLARIEEEEDSGKKSELQASLKEDQAKHNTSISNLTSALEKEKKALSDSASYQENLSDQIAEVERRNSQSSFTNFIEDWEAKQEERSKELADKLENLNIEKEKLIKQQNEMINKYNNTKAQIKQSYDEATNYYIDKLKTQEDKTKETTEKMISYFKRVTAAITEMMRKKSEAGMAVSQASGIGEVPQYANGGIVKSPTLAMIGEGGMNEAIVPLPNGRSIPVEMQGNSNDITINITGNNISSDMDLESIANTIQDKLTRSLQLQRQGSV